MESMRGECGGGAGNDVMPKAPRGLRMKLGTEMCNIEIHWVLSRESSK